MPDLNQTIATELAERYQKLESGVHELAAPLTDAQFWTKPFAFGNSFGHLVLHLTGNLNYYIGTQISQTGYTRDRPVEFSDATHPPKVEVLQRFDQAINVVIGAIKHQSAEDWSKPYTATGADYAKDRFSIFLACATHLHHHIGQMMYLAFELKQKV